MYKKQKTVEDIQRLLLDAVSAEIEQDDSMSTTFCSALYGDVLRIMGSNGQVFEVTVKDVTPESTKVGE